MSEFSVGRKCGLRGWGGRNFFGPDKKWPKGFAKKFSSPLDSLNPWNTLNSYGCFGPKSPNLTLFDNFDVARMQNL